MVVRSKLLVVLVTAIFFCTQSWANELITPIPLKIETDPSKVALGKKLFFDKRLSVDNTISCASCHNLEKGFGTDLKSVSTGIKNLKGVRNSPTVINAALNFTQFWDGRSTDLKAQALLPITNPTEMGMANSDDVVEKIAADSSYKKAFTSIYSQGITAENIADAIAEYEKTLLSVNSPFDQYLRGDTDAITQEQTTGYKLFVSYGCVSCHQGQNVGGNMFQKFGVLRDINLQKGSLGQDLGRYNITNNEWDKRVFKVPSLRLAVKTPPYFHNGSVATIEEAVDVMIKFQLGRKVPKTDRNAIIAFLSSLVGSIPTGAN